MQFKLYIYLAFYSISSSTILKHGVLSTFYLKKLTNTKWDYLECIAGTVWLNANLT